MTSNYMTHDVRASILHRAVLAKGATGVEWVMAEAQRASSASAAMASTGTKPAPPSSPRPQLRIR